METVLGFMGLILGAWAVRVICRRPPTTGWTIAKAVFAAGYFLAAGGIGGTQPENRVYAIVALVIGAAVVLLLSRRAPATPAA